MRKNDAYFRAFTEYKKETDKQFECVKLKKVVAESDTEKLITSLVGATSATIDSVYESDKVSGATQSANLITVAVKAVLADFDANVEAGE